MRISALISLSLSILSHAAEPVSAEPVSLQLERALYIETVEGDAAKAAALYAEIISQDPPTRAEAEAAFQLASMRAVDAKFAEAKALYFSVIRDFPDAIELNTLAEEELLKMVEFITREQVTSNPAAPHRLGDLAVALLGALENNETARAGVLLDGLNATLDSIGGGAVIFAQLRMQRKDLESTLHREGAAEALKKLKRSTEFEEFINRPFPAEPNDVLAPAWRMKDRVARALAANDAAEADRAVAQLQDYLAPITTLPVRLREGSLARLVSEAMRDIKAAVAAGKFPVARQRLDVLNDARHEQFPDQKIFAPMSLRVPENALAAGWAAHFRAELARRELNQNAHAVAMDHITEGANACKAAIALVDDPAVQARLQAQIDAFQAAYSAVEKNLIQLAHESLKKADGDFRKATPQ